MACTINSICICIVLWADCTFYSFTSENQCKLALPDSDEQYGEVANETLCPRIVQHTDPVSSAFPTANAFVMTSNKTDGVTGLNAFSTTPRCSNESSTVLVSQNPADIGTFLAIFLILPFVNAGPSPHHRYHRTYPPPHRHDVLCSDTHGTISQRIRKLPKWIPGSGDSNQTVVRAQWGGESFPKSWYLPDNSRTMQKNVR